MQAELGLHDSRNAAIHNAMMAENFAELAVPARAFIPTTTADDHAIKSRAQYDQQCQGAVGQYPTHLIQAKGSF